MKKWIPVLFFLCFGIIFNVNAVSVAAKQKYPYPLLTDDYGILSDDDIAAYTWGMKPRPFVAEEGSGGYFYWQCSKTGFV